MVESNPTSLPRGQGAGLPLIEFALVSALCGAGLAVGAAVLYATPAWALAAFGAGVLIAGRGLWLAYPHPELGLCNVVTLVRLALTALVFGALFEAQTAPVWAIFWIAVTAFALDGVDGYVARHTGLHSRFGARFDMETDAALGATLATWLLLSGAVGPAILILGYLRYAFALASRLLPALNAPLPQSWRRKTVCVVQIAALIFITVPGDPWGLDTPATLVASGLLLYSFGADGAWLLRRRG